MLKNRNGPRMNRWSCFQNLFLCLSYRWMIKLLLFSPFSVAILQASEGTQTQTWTHIQAHTSYTRWWAVWKLFRFFTLFTNRAVQFKNAFSWLLFEKADSNKKKFKKGFLVSCICKKLKGHTRFKFCNSAKMHVFFFFFFLSTYFNL